MYKRLIKGHWYLYKSVRDGNTVIGQYVGKV